MFGEGIVEDYVWVNGPGGFLYKEAFFEKGVGVVDFLDESFSRPEFDIILNHHLVTAYVLWFHLLAWDPRVDKFGPGYNLGEIRLVRRGWVENIDYGGGSVGDTLFRRVIVEGDGKVTDFCPFGHNGLDVVFLAMEIDFVGYHVR